jgi:predicted nucleic acid-binding protein
MRALTEQYLPFFSAVLPVDEAVAYRAAEVQASLRPTSQMLDLRDLLIAATALVHGLSICSLNTEHFRRVPGLHLEPLP